MMRLPRAVPALLLLAAAFAAARAQAGSLTCDQLNGAAIPSSAIGLPTSGATVASATVIPAAAPNGEYCRVLVAIHPVDPAAPDIRAQVNLPAAWNGKAVMFGGGGYDGSIPTTTANYFNGPADPARRPLAQGYATFGGDSGHVGNATLTSRDGSFALNEEAVQNFAGQHLKKTRDVAVHLLEAHYGHRPSRSYFVGGSTGGREGLWVAQRTPKDFDGVVSMYPAWNAATLDLQFGRITRALARPGGYPSPAKQLVWMNAVIGACDGLDGLEDGIVGNVGACRFDPATVRCEGGADTGDGCLSDAQIHSLRVYGSPLLVFLPHGSGEFFYPGFNVFAGADLTGPLDLSSQQPTSEIMTGGLTPAYNAMPYFSVFWDQWVKYFVTRDPTFDSLALDPQHPGEWREEVAARQRLQDVNGTDLGAFRRHGGKLLLMHGLADGLVATDATTFYWLRLIGDMGPKAVRSFARYYTIPGLGHVFGSPFASGGGFGAAWDPLTALDEWVETGKAPEGLVATGTNAAAPGRTRPVCEYPRFPRYVAGDPNLASSFRCSLR
jgi:feruloyl esterase